MMSEFVARETREGVSVLTLNRPDVLNSFNRQMAGELQQALDDAASDEGIRAVLLTGAGRAFCAGQDLAEASDPSADIADIVGSSYNPIIRRIRNLEKPVVCAVNGVAAGAGANIALACDIVFAAESASFIQSFSKIGLIPDSGGTFFLPRLVGMARATALMMLGEKLTAEQAQAIGLIYQTCPGTVLFDSAFALASSLAAQPTRGLGLTKRALNRSFTNNLDGQLKLEQQLQGEAGATLDYAEGVQAFLAKRKPAFVGK